MAQRQAKPFCFINKSVEETYLLEIYTLYIQKKVQKNKKYKGFGYLDLEVKIFFEGVDSFGFCKKSVVTVLRTYGATYESKKIRREF